MNKFLVGAAAAAAMLILGLSGASAAPLGGGQTRGASAESMVIHVDSGYCRELRLACENKERLGESGMGNCRRYREECGGDGRDHCERLRYRCLHKEELGREGEGLCRQYREECRGQ